MEFHDSPGARKHPLRDPRLTSCPAVPERRPVASAPRQQALAPADGPASPARQDLVVLGDRRFTVTVRLGAACS